MSIYIVTQMRFTNEARYRIYEAAFPKVFAQFNGKIIAADEAPKRVAGDAECDKIVILEFPSSDDAYAFMNSQAYQNIAPDRIAGTHGSSFLINGF